MVVEFLMARPKQKEIVRRIQTMAPTPYGEIRANLWHRDMKPMHLLRTKLSFFWRGPVRPKIRPLGSHHLVPGRALGR